MQRGEVGPPPPTALWEKPNHMVVQVTPGHILVFPCQGHLLQALLRGFRLLKLILILVTAQETLSLLVWHTGQPQPHL